MTVDEAKELLEKTETDFVNNKSHVLNGMMILSKYDDDIDCWFEHDQMWCSDFETVATQMSPEEIVQMGKFGWFEDNDAWSHF